ncbi:MAG TPA: hypothetical protein VGH74_05485 [Planctomycetaceae bacterium]|jgi:hypothetical protein
MPALLWKELRQLAPWGALMLTAISAVTLGSLYSEWYRYDVSHLWFQVWVVLVFGTPCVAFVTGALQTVLEVRRDQWAFLIHRGLSPTQIFLAKAGAGLVVYTIVALAPALIGLAWCAARGVDLRLLSWYHALPLLASCLAAAAFYFAAVLAIVWRGPWYFSRLLPLVAPVLMMFGVIGYTSEITEYVPLQLFLAIALAVGVHAVAAWGVFVRSGEASGRPRMANFSLAVPVFVALFGGCLCLFALAGAAYEWVGRVYELDKAWRARPYTNFVVNREGHILQVVSHLVEDGRSWEQQIVSIADVDEPQSTRYAGLVGQMQKVVNGLAAWDPLPLATVRYGGYSPLFGHLKPEQSPRHIIEQIGRNINSEWLGLTFSSPRGLIYAYRGNRSIEDRRNLLQPATLEYVIGPDGFVGGTEVPQHRFGNLLANSGDPWRQNSQYAWADLFKLSGNAQSCCLLFDDGLYLIDPANRVVRTLLRPADGKKIRGLTRLGDEIAVVYDDSISVHTATPVVLGTRKDFATGESVDETVDVPGDFRYSFPIPRELARLDEYSFGRLNGDRIVFTSGFGLSTFDLRRFIETRLDGTIVARRDFREPDPIPDGAAPPLAAVAAFVPPGPLVAAILVNEVQQLASGDAPGTYIRLFRNLPRGMLLATAVLLSSALCCGWSAGRTARRYGFDRRTRLVWQWTAVLLGPAALLTLWFLRDWPAFEKCPACAHRRPVDRDLCPRCAAPAATPLANGTEIIIHEPTNVAMSL